MLTYNNTFKKDIRILSFYANYDFEAKPTHIMRDVEVVVKKIVIKVY